MEQKTGFKEVFLRLVAIVGLIAVLILGAWGIILLAFNLVGLFSGTMHWSDIWSHPATQQVATTTPAVTIVQPASTGSNANSSSNSGSGYTSAPSAVYTAAPTRAQLYGLPDLAVSITSVIRSTSVAGRVIVSFIVSNAGTNVAASGWAFNATLPLTPSYTYQSQGEQALYPGDKIAFTLTYDDPSYNNVYNQNYNQVCSQQYPYTCTYNTQYNQYPYNTQPQTCYTYNGYTNIPGPCAYGYDQNGNPIYGSNTNYTYNNQYPYNVNANYYGNTGYGYNPYTTGTVTITVDPQNWVVESNKYNNTASRSF